MVNKSEKIIICGPSGSGKDYLLRELSSLGFVPSVKVTTRPRREKEIEGVNYKFIDTQKFKDMMISEDFLVSQDFINDKGDNWNYGILKEDFDKSQVFIMTPSEISQLPKEKRKGSFVIYLCIDRNVRESRINIRKDNNDSIRRRLDSDDIDFYGFVDYDLKLTDPMFTTAEIISLMV